MKYKAKLTIIALIVASSLTTSSVAQQVRRISHSSPSITQGDSVGNISVNLKIYKEGKIKEDIAFSLANRSMNFMLDHMVIDEGKIQPLRFSGDLSIIDDQTYLINYNFSQSIGIKTGDNTQYRDFGWLATIEIKKGTEEVLMKYGDLVYTLSIGGSLKRAE